EVALEGDLGGLPGGDPPLVYDSNRVSVHPIAQVPFASLAADGVPTAITLDATFDGTALPKEVFSAAGHSPGDTYLLGVQDPSAVTSTGLHSWTFDAKAVYPDGQTQDVTS